MRIFLGLGAASLLAAGCLLVTSLDGLEGPPLESAAGADGASDSGAGGDQMMEDAGLDTVPGTDALSGPVIFVDRRSKNDAALKLFPKGIALTDTEVYWVEAQPGPVGILHAPKDGSAAPLHVDRLTDGLNDPFDVGLDGTFLYWSDFTGNLVRRKPLNESNLASDYFPGSGHAAYLAVGNTGTIYVSDYWPAFGSVDLGPGNPTSLAVSVDAAPVSGVAFCTDTLYWAWGQPSNIAAKSSPENTQIAPQKMFISSPGGAITGITCSGAELYWIEDNQSIHWIDSRSKVLNDPIYTSDSDMGAGDIAVDDRWIYFTEPAHHVISKVARPGGERDR